MTRACRRETVASSIEMVQSGSRPMSFSPSDSGTSRAPQTSRKTPSSAGDASSSAKSIAIAVHRPHVARLARVVADLATDLGDQSREARFSDVRPRPKFLEELVLGDRTRPPLDQEPQISNAFGDRCAGRVSSMELPADRIKMQSPNRTRITRPYEKPKTFEDIHQDHRRSAWANVTDSGGDAPRIPGHAFLIRGRRPVHVPHARIAARERAMAIAAAFFLGAAAALAGDWSGASSRRSRGHLLAEVPFFIDRRLPRALQPSLDEAFRRLSDSRCAEIFTDFTDCAGRRLDLNLADTGASAPSYLGLVLFYDGRSTEPCRNSQVLAWTNPGSRGVLICWEQFSARQRGASVSPRTRSSTRRSTRWDSARRLRPRVITDQVALRCGR